MGETQQGTGRCAHRVRGEWQSTEPHSHPPLVLPPSPAPSAALPQEKGRPPHHSLFYPAPTHVQIPLPPYFLYVLPLPLPAEHGGLRPPQGQSPSSRTTAQQGRGTQSTQPLTMETSPWCKAAPASAESKTHQCIHLVLPETITTWAERSIPHSQDLPCHWCMGSTISVHQAPPRGGFRLKQLSMGGSDAALIIPANVWWFS